MNNTESILPISRLSWGGGYSYPPKDFYVEDGKLVFVFDFRGIEKDFGYNFYERLIDIDHLVGRFGRANHELGNISINQEVLNKTDGRTGQGNTLAIAVSPLQTVELSTDVQPDIKIDNVRDAVVKMDLAAAKQAIPQALEHINIKKEQQKEAKRKQEEYYDGVREEMREVKFDRNLITNKAIVERYIRQVVEDQTGKQLMAINFSRGIDHGTSVDRPMFEVVFDRQEPGRGYKGPFTDDEFDNTIAALRKTFGESNVGPIQSGRGFSVLITKVEGTPERLAEALKIAQPDVFAKIAEEVRQKS